MRRWAGILIACLAGVVMAKELPSSSHVGKIADSQGIVTIRPVMAERWTPVEQGFLVQPGDWLRTDVRGGNAVNVRLKNRAGLILGPGTLVELTATDGIRVHGGELEVSVPEGQKLEIDTGHNEKTAVEGCHVFLVKDGKIQKLDDEPNWLKYFKGTVTTETLGSLVAKVDGRDVPLSVGYHKVTVDIRDQIARTVIEESFVNNTDGRLEGVFYFPLPQDASISSFGMWIGDSLVEADIVEKERAREIYETILRERRDPGLLEWTGGNIFKARVFPIFAHSEKRIKISYTQVLPMKNGRCRYSYALQSEMLKQHPLRELALDVRVNSALPLKSVTCPTHNVRSDMTEHSAHVEFSAQEYTPDRDFEVEIEVDYRNAPVTMISHRRGDDGYFLLMLTTPAVEGAGERTVIPDGAPLELLILADTSGSMDESSRRARDSFIAAMLSSLGPKDSFNIATCDVTCEWFSPKPVRVDETNVAAARDFVVGRRSLGWSDLDTAIASAIERAGPRTQVIYVGDGIITTGDADPVAFTKRLQCMAEGKSGTFHAVATGSSFEPAVMKTIASIGGGSFRRIEGSDGSRLAAMQLLGETTRPPIKNLKVSFNGFNAARVYPEELPNLPAGLQQIVLGRYLPDGKTAAGEVVVTGTKDGKPVEFRAPVSFKDAEQGNSFIPRLWARMHLDTLLEQGRSQEIKDEIVALSEEYQIMTPYTSFLVLESDADRERFGVKQQFRMRDGEKFFAEGRDSANVELAQKQMKAAGNWRLNLRRRAMQQAASLGRDPNLIAPRPEYAFDGNGLFWGDFGGLGVGHAMVGVGGGGWTVNGTLALSGSSSYWDMSGGNRYAGGLKKAGFGRASSSFIGDPTISAGFVNVEDGDSIEFDRELSDAETGGRDESKKDKDGISDDWETTAEQEQANEPMRLKQRLEKGLSLGGEYEAYDLPMEELRSYNRRGAAAVNYFDLYARKCSEDYRGDWNLANAYWLQSLFPTVPAPRQQPPPVKLELVWPEEARKLSESLLRFDKLTALKGGLEVVGTSENYDVREKRTTSVSSQLSLISGESWLTRSVGDSAQTRIEWCDLKERGAIVPVFGLGRVRASVTGDVQSVSLPIADSSLVSLESAYRGYCLEIEKAGSDRVLLHLKVPKSPTGYEVNVAIDTRRHVVVGIETVDRNKTVWSQKFTDFVEVGGCWWATKVEMKDAEGRITSATTLKVNNIPSETLKTRFADVLKCRNEAIVISEPLPNIQQAKQAIADNKATFADQLVMLGYFGQSQQWDRANEHLEAAAKLLVGKPGMEWIRNGLLSVSRRHEELRQRLVSVAKALAGKPALDELFLANYVLQQSQQAGQQIEMLALLDVLKPVYDRQPERILAGKQWRQSRVQYLQNSGQADIAFAIQQSLAREFPMDCNLQVQYANSLAGRGDNDAACNWLALQLLVNRKLAWLPGEIDSLRNAYIQILQNQGRYDEAVLLLEKWLESKPANLSLYQQYLSALLRSNQEKKAEDTMTLWLAIQPPRDGEWEPAQTMQLTAAVYQALGQGYNMYVNNIEERWLEPLARVVRVMTKDKTNGQMSDQIMNNWYFQRTDTCRGMRGEALDILLKCMDSLDPVQIGRYAGWVLSNDPVVENDIWKGIAKEIEDRWAAEKDRDNKARLAQTLVSILSSRASGPELLAFLHRQLRESPEEQVPACTRQLFDALLNHPWSTEYEDEAFSLIGRLADTNLTVELRQATKVQALYRLTDAMVQARYNSVIGAVEHKEKLSRVELKALEKESLSKARARYVLRLAAETGKQDAALEPWITVERLYLDTLLKNNTTQIVAECWEYVGVEPPAKDKVHVALDDALLARYLGMLEYLAAQPKADPAIGERLLAYYGKAIAADPDNAAWKMAKYRMLLLLDRPAVMEETLKSWIKPGDADNTWRLMLGYLLAEKNRIPEAIKQFEAIRKTDELGPAEYRALANWYLVRNERNKYEEAIIAALMVEEEYQLSNRLYQERNRWCRGPEQMPKELDPMVARIFTALFRKSQSPQNYLSQLRDLYQYSRDFRLLECLAEGVIGHSAAQVYPFVGRMQEVLCEIREEATCDSVSAQIAVVRERATTRTDQRALDMLETQVRRRSAELRNQPGPHVDAALAAMKRAFKGEWAEGERRLMAELLAALGKIAQEPLAAEVIGELKVLHDEEKTGTFDRLQITLCLGRSLWNHEKWSEAIDTLESGLTEFRTASGGILPQTANGALDAYAGFLESRGQFVRGEKALLAEIARPVNEQQKYWVIRRLYGLYTRALQDNGEVSLGKGQELYKTVESRMIADLSINDQDHRFNLVGQICSLYRTAKNRQLAGVAGDLKTFSMNRIPAVLARQTSNYENIVSTVSGTLHDVAGPLEGLAFLVERIENEPYWFTYNNQDGWSRYSWNLAQWRVEAKNLGELDGRLLKIVVGALRRDLRTQQARNRVMYDRRNSYFWDEKAAVFSQTAEEVLKERLNSGAAVKYIAEYLYRSLDLYDRAIAILLDAQARKLPDEAGQEQLVVYLHERNRHAESITILDPLVKWRPDNVTYRCQLMRAWFKTGQKTKLTDLRGETDAYFHEKNLWNEANISALAYACLDDQLYEESVAYYKEVIPLHQRTQPNRGIGNGTLSQYYSWQAQAYSGLGRTSDAVEAACGAIVSWGPNRDQRQYALQNLLQTVRSAPDLDKYATEVDKQATESHLENPIVRKALGQIYLEKKEFVKAVAQLRLAVEAQPNDTEIYTALVAVLDQQGDKQGAIQQLLDSAELSRRDIASFKNLGERYVALQRTNDAERANTMIVEMLPNESESHAMLAEIRQSQNRWLEAIEQWQQVTRVRSIEPTGYLKLAEAQIHEKQWLPARDTIKTLMNKSWPNRFGDVQQQARNLLSTVERGEK